MVREREAQLGFGSDVMVSAGDLHMELITIWCNMKSEKKTSIQPKSSKKSSWRRRCLS